MKTNINIVNNVIIKFKDFLNPIKIFKYNSSKIENSCRIKNINK